MDKLSRFSLEIIRDNRSRNALICGMLFRHLNRELYPFEDQAEVRRQLDVYDEELAP